MDSRKTPTITDYLAAGVIANFIVTIWNMTPNDYIFYLLSLPVYTIAGAVSSYLVCTRSSSGFLGVGIKSAFISWLCVIILISVMTNVLTSEFILTLLITFNIGSIIVAYYIQRKTLRNKIIENINTSG
ncbi:hypothetical protein FJY84_02235 [Candidatus Bathyarchaeota archaeon]|nr:hypothetical protein [Candidatus Bathyarchaeota archaeon]